MTGRHPPACGRPIEAQSAITSIAPQLFIPTHRTDGGKSSPRNLQDPTSFSVRSHTGDANDWDRVEGNWKQLKGKAQQQWGKLTKDDLDVIEGKQAELSGRLQERYGIAKDEADRQIDTWMKIINGGCGRLDSQPAARFLRKHSIAFEGKGPG